MALKNRMQKNIDMTKGNIYALLISFALPLLLGDLFQQLYNLADTWVIGNFATNDEYAAVGACSHILNLIIKTFIGLSSGAGIVIARHFGAGEQDKVKKASSTAMYIALICSVLFTIAGRVLGPMALRLSNVPDSVYHHAKSYLDIIFSLVAAQIIYNMGAGVLRAVGDSRKPFFFLVAASIVNVILDLFFVVALKMGIKGVAWATAIAQCVAAALTVIELFETNTDVALKKGELYFEKALSKEIVTLGIPTAVQMAITALSNVLIQSYINGLGVDFLSGYSTYTKCEQLLFMAANSMGVACMTFVSQNMGAMNIERSKTGVKSSIVIMASYTVVVTLFVVIFAPQISAFFNSETKVIEYSVMALRLATPLFVIQGTDQILMGALRGCGDTKTPLFMQVGFNVLFRQISIRIITKFIAYTPFSVCIVQPLSWIVLFCAMMVAYKRSKLFRE